MPKRLCRRRRSASDDPIQRVAGIPSGAAFKTWLLAVIRRTAADERRRDWLRKLGLVRRERMAVAAEPDPPPVLAHRTELQTAFQQALTGLPHRQQQVLHLVFYQDLSLNEAGWGISSVAARTAQGSVPRCPNALCAPDCFLP